MLLLLLLLFVVILRTLMVFRVNGVWHVATHRLAVVIMAIICLQKNLMHASE